MTKSRLFVFMLIFIAAGSLTFAQNGRLVNLSGRVEIQLNEGGPWRPAVEGETIPLAATISTGFNSSATLQMGTNNVIIRALTRMTLDEYAEREGVVTTSLHLRVGAVRASVDSSRGIDQNFQVTSPFSTASVRGTEFETDGSETVVFEGQVAVFFGAPERPRGSSGQQQGSSGSGESEDEPEEESPGQSPGSGESDGQPGDEGNQGDQGGEPGEPAEPQGGEPQGGGSDTPAPPASEPPAAPPAPPRGPGQNPVGLVSAGQSIQIAPPRASGPGTVPVIVTPGQRLQAQTRVTVNTAQQGAANTPASGGDQPPVAAPPVGPPATSGSVAIQWTGWRD